ncbi:hypothetical protein RRU01S_33_00200 [Agrobacterium rubi TR3 = NBRC 13261]|uniref:Cytochrome P460 domain-containing protein n=1 Tax=Agrobacterium rubi TR3 = NBRC 13261 TaxID=1368415 RepID=A0A081D2S0_9HYPH|nr:cytochrome P460 family protein [Agrobacterium rubi]MBP1881456.1 hypothetical protein [Agrobacterium rubi]GAK73216.1 hypothetical protein RRU01S_33_00200 [Agrobacterium rubi TR3 = NBRC 13261]
MPFTHRISLMATAVIAFAFSSFTAVAENRATFPKDFSRYVLYATYDRGSSKEEAFAAPETLALAKSGQPLPPGTQLVLGIWSNYKLTDYFVMEKGIDWGLDIAADKKTGDWHFQQFDPNGQMRRTAIASRCESCHQGQASNDFLFTRDRMDTYLP